MKIRRVAKLCLTSALSCVCFAQTPARAAPFSITTTVSMVEATYMPKFITFNVTSPAGACGAGALLYWQAQGADEPSQIANTQAIFALLLTAETSGKSISIWGDDSNCTVNCIHILS